MDSATLAILLGSSSLLSTIVGFIITWLKDGRNRRWSEEDRRRIALEQKEEQKRVAGELEKVTTLAHKDLADRVDANTKISADAFKEANGHNAKILSLAQTVATVPAAAAAAAVMAVQATTPTTLLVEAAKNPNPNSP